MKQNKKIFLLPILFCLTFALYAETDLGLNFSKTKNYAYSPCGLESSPFHLSLAVDIPTAVTGATLFSLGVILKPEKSSYDGSVFDINNMNLFDKWAVTNYNKGFDIASTVLSALTFAMPAVLFTTDVNDYLVWLVMYAETMLIVQGSKELTKHYVYRPRPYMYFADYPQDEVVKGDYCESFFSGHTALSFAAATFATITFAQYFPTSVWRAPVIATSFTLALAVAAFRIASGSHFFSDVLVGAAFGSLIGAGVPLLHKINTKINKKIATDPNSPIEQLNLNLIAGGVSATIKF